MSLKKLQKAFENFGNQYKVLWLNPGHMRWVAKGIDPNFVSVMDLGKLGDTPGSRKKKRNLAIVGALTFPIGLPVALATLPFVFLFSGAPFLRKNYLDKVTKIVKKELDLHDINGQKCARQVAKLITGIGHPRGELVCERCREKVEDLAREAAQEIQLGKVKVDPNDLNRLLESREERTEKMIGTLQYAGIWGD
jgi:hypothetical protein